MSRDPEYQADCTKSIVLQWESGAMTDNEAVERIAAIYHTYEYRRRV